MITPTPQVYILEPGDSLTPLTGAIGAKRLYLDVETTSFEHDSYGNKPYAGHRLCGYAVTWDDHPSAYYIPIRHKMPHWNVELEPALRLLHDLVSTAEEWCNANVKFDAHFCAVDGAEFGPKTRLVDLTTRAKMIDSDRIFSGKGGYGLDVLARDWLDLPISAKDNAVQSYLANFRNGNKACKDYAVVGADLLGDYACHDVLAARRLDIYERRVQPALLNHVWEIETLLTPVLYDIEKKGMRVNVAALQATQFMIMTELNAIAEVLHSETGLSIVPHKSADCYELLVNHFGLPVLEFTEEGNPSFNAEALNKYCVHPDVITNPKRTHILKLLERYRDRHTLLTVFVEPYLEQQVNGILHPDYNQLIRTGRMSCKQPNAQQLSHDAKEFIEPDPGCAFLSADQSQIEFRCIVHYINDIECVNAYLQDPDTDFHTWVAKECGIPRKPAKTVNFMVGYGGGKKKVISQLAQNKDLVSSLVEQARTQLEDPNERYRCEQIYRIRHKLERTAEVAVDDLQRDLFEFLCTQRGEHVYETYHNRLPGIRIESDRAYHAALSRGWVKTVQGRMRHLPPKAAWRAFNSVCQGSAADFMKDVTVKLAPRYNPEVRALGLELVAQVHDENLLHGDREITRDPATIKLVANIMEAPTIPLRVPLRIGAGWSDKNWAIASGDEGKLWKDGVTRRAFLGELECKAI